MGVIIVVDIVFTIVNISFVFVFFVLFECHFNVFSTLCTVSTEAVAKAIECHLLMLLNDVVGVVFVGLLCHHDYGQRQEVCRVSGSCCSGRSLAAHPLVDSWTWTLFGPSTHLQRHYHPGRFCRLFLNAGFFASPLQMCLIGIITSKTWG